MCILRYNSQKNVLIYFKFEKNKIKGLMTVFINGVPTEVTEGAIDMKAMFGEDLALMHSSGLPLPIDEFGFLMHSLQHGQSYFLVTQFNSLLSI